MFRRCYTLAKSVFPSAAPAATTVVATSLMFLMVVAVPAFSQQFLTPQMLQADLGIGDVTPPGGAQTFAAYNGWQGGRAFYQFVAAGFTTPYVLTSELQLNSWNYVIFGTPRVQAGVTQQAPPEIQALTASQRTALRNGNYATVEPPAFTPGTPIQVSETAKSQDGFFYLVLNFSPLAVIPQYSGYIPTITACNFVITPPSGTILYNMSIPVNPSQAAWNNVALTVSENVAGVIIDAAAGGAPVTEFVQSLYTVVQALQGSSHPAPVIEFTGSNVAATGALALQNIYYLVAYEAPTDIQNLTLNISASVQWSYSLATPSGTIVNPTPPSNGSYGPIQTTITIP